MKKLLLILAAAMSMYLVASSQERSAGYEKKAFLIFTAGPSFPVGDFTSKNLDNDQAGLAKTGFNLDLQGGYRLIKSVGVTSSIFYSREAIDQKILNGTSVSVDHWQYYGIVIGPMITQNLTPKIAADFNVMTGVVNANSPKFSYNGEVIFPEDWAVAVPVRVSGDMRVQFARNGYFLIGVNYLYLNPEFKTTALGETYRAHQRITVVNLNGGIGFRF